MPAHASGGCGLAFANTTTSSGALPLLANSILSLQGVGQSMATCN